MHSHDWPDSLLLLWFTVFSVVDLESTDADQPFVQTAVSRYVERPNLLCESIHGLPPASLMHADAIRDPDANFAEAVEICDAETECLGIATYVGTQDEQSCALFCGRALLCSSLASRMQKSKTLQEWRVWAREALPEKLLVSDETLASPSDNIIIERADSMNHPSLPFLDCVGPAFDGRWLQLQQYLKEDLKTGFLVRPPLSELVQEMWNEIFYQTEGNFVYFLNQTTSLFYSALIGETSPSALDGHCHYGYVALFAARGRHLSLQEGSSSDAEDLLRLALGPLLGPYLCFDFMESSAWPLHSHHIAALLSNSPMNASMPSLAEKSVLWSETSIKFPSAVSSGSIGALKVMIAGAHHGYALEPAEMIRRATGAAIDAKYLGVLCPSSWRTGGQTNAWTCTFRCEHLGVCEDDGIAMALMSIFDFKTWTIRDYDLGQFYTEVYRVIAADRVWSEGVLTVCTGPFVLCAAIVYAVSEIRPGYLLPMLIYQGLSFHSMAPQTEEARHHVYSLMEQACRLVDIDGWSVSCPSQDSLVVAANHPLNAAQLLWQTGVQVPVVRYHGLYTQAQRPSVLNDAILIFRFTLWERPVGFAFRELLRSFHEASGVSTTFVFLEPKHYLSYKEMVSYLGVFLFPWDSELLTFHELYSACVPLIMPDLHWMSKWQPFIPWGSTDAASGKVRNDWVVKRMASEYVWPCAPWIENSGVLKGDWSSLQAQAFNNGCSLFWLQQTHFLRYPHVIHVRSLPELVTLPASIDVSAISSGMAQFNTQTLKTSLRFYRWAVGHLLDLSGEVEY